MAKATVTTKSGATVVIEGSDEEVHRLLGRIEDSSGSATRSKNDGTKSSSERRSASVTDAILQLNKEGFFDEPRKLSDIQGRLASEGMIYPVTTLSGVVLTLVRRRALGRLKKGINWVYVSR